MKTTLISVSVLLLTVSAQPGHAYNPYYAPQPGYAQQASVYTDPAQSIHEALDKLNTFSQSTNSANPVLLRSFIENEIIPHFAFNEMAQWITGPYARFMSQADRNSFASQLKDAFLGSLAKHIGSFDPNANQVQILGARSSGGNEAIVPIQVYRKDSYPARLDFRMRHDGFMWRIIDVKANGTSAVLHYRKHFLEQLRQYHSH
jgi:ABC-type transporter MlaC component